MAINCELVLPALLYDPIKLWTGLFYFTLSLFSIPILFYKVSEVVLSIGFFIIYIINAVYKYFLPTRSQFSHHFRGQMQEDEDPLFSVLRLIGSWLFNRSVIRANVNSDFDLSGPAHVSIGNKLKIPFFIGGLALSLLVLTIPSVAFATGAYAFSCFLVTSGIPQMIATYASALVMGTLLYSLRAPFVGLTLLIRSCFKSPGELEYQRQGDNQDDSGPDNFQSAHSGLNLLAQPAASDRDSLAQRPTPQSEIPDDNKGREESRGASPLAQNPATLFASSAADDTNNSVALNQLRLRESSLSRKGTTT